MAQQARQEYEMTEENKKNLAILNKFLEAREGYRRLGAEKGRFNDAAEKLLKRLCPSSKPFVFHQTKPPGDSDRN